MLFNYEVIIKKQGTVIGHRVVRVPNALTAMNMVEMSYGDQARPVTYSTGKNTTATVLWTGLEFEARRI